MIESEISHFRFLRYRRSNPMLEGVQITLNSLRMAEPDTNFWDLTIIMHPQKGLFEWGNLTENWSNGNIPPINGHCEHWLGNPTESFHLLACEKCNVYFVTWSAPNDLDQWEIWLADSKRSPDTSEWTINRLKDRQIYIYRFKPFLTIVKRDYLCFSTDWKVIRSHCYALMNQL
jgi:hypothetical protein